VKISDFDELVDYVGRSFGASKQDIFKAKRSIIRAILVGFKGWPNDEETVDKSSGNPTPKTQDSPQTENPATPAENLANQDASAEDPATILFGTIQWRNHGRMYFPHISLLQVIVNVQMSIYS
jgi:hypothetical protein